MNADQETAIDVAARRRLAEAIRHFAAGQITNVQFDQRIPVTSEAALTRSRTSACGRFTMMFVHTE